MHKNCRICGKEFGHNMVPSILKLRKHCSKACWDASKRHSDAQFAAAFWSRVEKTEGCWLYRGALNKDGYGTLSRRTKMLSAHRFAWTLTHGEPPKGMCVLHKCDVRNCVNPDHLFLGTKKDNAQDKLAKGRVRSRYQPVEELLYPHLSRRGLGGRGKGRKDRHTG